MRYKLSILESFGILKASGARKISFSTFESDKDTNASSTMNRAVRDMM